jgi:hypothetical protein
MRKNITKIIRKLRQKDGMSYPFIVCIVLVLFIITLGVCEVIRIHIISLSMGGSKATHDIAKGYIRMYASMVVMMILK